MIRETKNTPLVINLDGPDGNVFSLMGAAAGLARRMGMDYGYIEFIFDEMKSGDYMNAVKTFDKHFGEFVILETTNEELLSA